MVKSHEFNLSSSTNSNSNLEFDQHDSHDSRAIQFIDGLDENNNRQFLNTTSENLLSNNNLNNRSNHLFPPVKFVTHFSNIKEDEDKN
jgi:hypothetical protein